MEPMNTTAREAVAPRGPSVRALVWWTLGLVLVASLLIHLPYEVSYWMLALAEKASQEGRTDDALALVEQAKPWTPKSLLPQKMRVQVLKRAGKIGELASIDLLLEGNPPNADKAVLYLRKSALYEGKGQWEQAVREFDAAAALVGKLRPSLARLELLIKAQRQDEAKRELAQIQKEMEKSATRSLLDNTVAYYSALIGDDLEAALQRAEAALAADPQNPAILDTRGFVLYRLGRFDQALPDLQASVERMDETVGSQPARYDEKKALAVIVYHRSLALDALEKSAEAERDRQTVRELGFEPSPRLF